MTTDHSAKGWCAINPATKKLDLRTLSPTRRAAVVNALVLHYQITPLDSWSDFTIEGIWEQAINYEDVMRRVKVEIIHNEDQ